MLTFLHTVYNENRIEAHDAMLLRGSKKIQKMWIKGGEETMP